MKSKITTAIASLIVVLMVLGAQMAPLPGLFNDDLIEIADITDTESDEKEENEKEETKEGQEKFNQGVALSFTEYEKVSSRNFWKNQKLPSTPFFEIIGPPPDCI